MAIYVGDKRYAPYIGDKRRRYMGGVATTDTEDFIFDMRIHTMDTLKGANQYSDVVTRYFEVTGGHEMKWNAATRSSYVKINELGNDKSFILQTSNKAFPYTFTLNANTAFVRFCTLQSVLDNAYLYDVTDNKWIWKGKDAKLT